jgi:RNA polymerase sigma-70 factor, ECF subfamily
LTGDDDPSSDASPRGGPAPDPPGTTEWLLIRVRGGDRAAREELVARFLPALRRWAHRRLPRPARDLRLTDDLVHDSFLRALEHVDTFESRYRGAFFAYLTRILRNQVVDEIRRAGRRPVREEVPEDLPANIPTPLQDAIGRETLAVYEAALNRLPPKPRETIVLRIDLGLKYEEIARALGYPSVSAARMAVKRALLRLAEEMSRNGKKPEPET